MRLLAEKTGNALPDDRDEWLSVSLAFCWFMLLMAGYYVLKPLRESLGASLGRPEISRLFVGTFLVMIILVPIYSYLVTKVPRRVLLHVVFHFLSFNVLLFAAAHRFADPDSKILARVYFIWVSVFSLFAVSVFWSVLTDLFSREQGKRLFGIIASGATVGALLGSLIANRFSTLLGTTGLLILVFIFLELGMLFAGLLQRVARRTRERATMPDEASVEIAKPDSPDDTRIGGMPDEGPIASAMSGLREIVASRYLITICVYFVLISACGTVIYMQMMGVAHQTLPDPDQRTAFFAGVNFWAQVGTLIMQAVLIGPIMRRLGLSVALAILPAVYLVSFLALSFNGSLYALGMVSIASQIAVYGATSPSREVLFTVVNRRAKYAAKNLMDTVLIRGSDSLTSNLFVQLEKVLAVTYFGFLMVPITILFLATGWTLGRQQRKICDRNS